MGFAPGPGQGGNSSIAGSSDVSLNSVQNDQVLSYDSDASKWQNKAVGGGDVSDLVLGNNISSTDSTGWVNIPALAINQGASDQVWVCNYTLLYAGDVSDGISVRLRNGSDGSGYINNNTHTVHGYWQGIVVNGTPTNSNFSRVEVVNYPGSFNLYGNFGAIDGASTSMIRGEFRIGINGSDLETQTIGIEFKKRLSGTGNPVTVLAGSYATIARAA